MPGFPFLPSIPGVRFRSKLRAGYNCSLSSPFSFQATAGTSRGGSPPRRQRARRSDSVSVLDGLYFNVVTFTTLGFGDLHSYPERCLAVALQALCGYVYLGLGIGLAVGNRVPDNFRRRRRSERQQVGSICDRPKMLIADRTRTFRSELFIAGEYLSSCQYFRENTLGTGSFLTSCHSIAVSQEIDHYTASIRLLKAMSCRMQLIANLPRDGARPKSGGRPLAGTGRNGFPAQIRRIASWGIQSKPESRKARPRKASPWRPRGDRSRRGCGGWRMGKNVVPISQ